MSEHRVAGRELDCEVAEKFMGWRVHNRNTAWWVEKELETSLLSSGGVMGLTCGTERFSPSTNIADAWRVVEKMRAMGFGCHITAVSNLDRTRHFWAVDFSNPNTERSGHEHDTTAAPLAICIAALAALDPVDSRKEE